MKPFHIFLLILCFPALIRAGTWQNNVSPSRSKFDKHVGSGAKKCHARMVKRGGPLLFPQPIELNLDQEALFRSLIEHVYWIMYLISEDSVHHRDGMKATIEDWKTLKRCIPHYRYILQEDMTHAFLGLKEVAKVLARVAPAIPGETTMLLSDDLAMTTLKLVGFLSEMYADIGMPQWLLEQPSASMSALLSYLACDITKPSGCVDMPDFQRIYTNVKYQSPEPPLVEYREDDDPQP
ncbi:hypothetical protein GMORB2_3759 [Geosmithia morbida]|uniref:Uncharacterized protein n=1 Tax=Geosmithia morbida TaxID=1094350 RepID=A0A9P4YXY8_9HYPO|nr:uncharacterized protein GMORB2_3759 [Geosmithia morbida]KAF4124920.1 hypothetical protein GMORB2_3759 [Geosmithia morbida]